MLFSWKMLKPWNGNKATARARFSKYVRYHNFTKPPCEICGESEPDYIVGHHEDYARPFHVRWLCIKHHKMLHCKKLSLIPIEIVPVYELVELADQAKFERSFFGDKHEALRSMFGLQSKTNPRT